MNDITLIREAADLIAMGISGHGDVPDKLRQLAERMEAEAALIGVAEVARHFGPDPKGYADDGVAQMAHYHFNSKVQPWIIEMRRRGYAVELDFQVHVSKIGADPEVDQVMGGLRFTKNVQVVL